MEEKQDELLPLGHLGLLSEMTVLAYCLGLDPGARLPELLFYKQLLTTQAAPVAMWDRAAQTM